MLSRVRLLLVAVFAVLGVVTAALAPAARLAYSYDSASAATTSASNVALSAASTSAGTAALTRTSDMAEHRLGAAEEAGAAAEAGAGTGPSFTGFEEGPPAIVPEGARGPLPTRGPGMQYVEGAGGHGLDSQVTGVRIMDQTPQHSPRVVHMNETGQSVNPLTGQTVSRNDPWAHIPW